MGGQGREFSQILAVWLELVSYRHRHLVVGNLVGIVSNVPFGGNSVLNRVVYCFDTGSLARIGIDIPYTGTGRSVFWSVF
jgi:hypothetical protein